MKKLSIILTIILVAMISCTKSKEVHPEIGDGNDEIVTVGIKDVHVEYTRIDHAELNRVVFHYCPADANGNAQQFKAAEMTKKETFFELTLNELLSDTLYWYYYDLFPSNGDAFSTALKTFYTQSPSSFVDHEYVDLGLPSGLLWATCNVGADMPEGYGDYFAWGETQTKSDYNWSSYQHSNGGTSWQNPNLTKYCYDASCGYNGYTDNLTTLLPEDDAATANWGNGWRMPTIEEFHELLNNTTMTWTMQNGVNGCLFTATNGYSLFLPASGIRDGHSHYGVGGRGDYWSSSLPVPDGSTTALLFSFFSDNYNWVGSSRVYGLSVRAVRSAKKN